MIEFVKQNLISILVTVFLMLGLFILLQVFSKENFKKLHHTFTSRKPSVRKRRKQIISGEVTENPISKYFREAKNILIQTGKVRLYPVMKVSMLVAFAAGIFISFVSDNYFLLPVLPIGLGILPLIIVHRNKSVFIREFYGTMKTALGVITNTYIQCEDILKAVETNLNMIPPPLFEPFKQFVNEGKYAEANLPRVISSLKRKIDNRIFKEWCDILIQCSANKDLKYVLPLIVDKIDEVIKVQAELDTKTSQDVSGVRTLLILNVLMLPFMYLVEHEWYVVLVSSIFGKAIIAFILAVCFISLFYSVKVLRPVEYR